MSTRAVIGVYSNREQGQWRGTYHHFDGYPHGLGQSLWKLYHEFYKGLLPAMVEMLIDAHPQGWSSIADADWNKRPTWLEYDARMDLYARGEKLPPQSYKYRPGESHEPNYLDQTSDAWQEWAYVFDLESNTMSIFERIGNWSQVSYALKGTVPLDGTEPHWESFE